MRDITSKQTFLTKEKPENIKTPGQFRNLITGKLKVKLFWVKSFRRLNQE